MATLPKYRFLPWTRRGLVAEVQQPDGGGNLPSRAALPVAITVSNVTPVTVNLRLYGPGDVIGVDPRLIIRVEPRPFVTDCEPNYLAAIEFDLPDFPWMFTPARANAQHRLRPWCVLVVLDKSVVALPRVNRGAPLPTITVPAEVSTRELPNLSESWAWAHTQVVSDADQPQVIEGELAAAPQRNLSRLLCPRRLEPNRQYFACLVPAFDLGVQRGLGLAPDGDTAKPAWDVNNAGEVKLPLYYHWEFATGPGGDFEALARQLTPLKSPADIGLQRMYIGQAGDGLPQKPPTATAAYTLMEGALRAPKGSPSTLAGIPADLQTGLQQALNAPASVVAGTTAQTPTLAPPIYGEWHINKHTVQSNSLPWLRELNLDPRMRSAAGLGAEVVRANQEELMQICWDQVGEVIKANDRLNWGRLALDMGRRLYERHYLTLPVDRLLQVTSLQHGGAPLGNHTVREAIRQTSLPDASYDPALRRLTSPQRPWLKSVARRANFAQPGSRSTRTALSVSLMSRKVGADPTQFVPDGVAGAALLDAVNVPPTATQVDLAPFGIQARLARDSANRMKTLRSQLVNIQPQNAPAVQVRANLQTGGLITEAHLDKLRELQAEVLADARTQPEREAGRLNMHVTAAQLIARTRGVTNAVAFMVNAEPDAPTPVGALSVERDGELVWRSRPTDAGVTIATLGARIKGSNPQTLQLLLSRLRAGALDVVLTPGGRPPGIDLENGGIVVRRTPLSLENLSRAVPAAAVATKTLTTTLLPPVVTPIPVQRFGQAFAQMTGTLLLNEPVTVGAFAAFDIAAARQALVTNIRPDTVIPRRIRGLIRVEGGEGLDNVGGLRVLPTFDRIMAAPEIDGPMYEFLIKYDRERFLPGIGQIPADSITLLETNPRFIEAFMVGLNYEMNRELLWREYPTDQRGTVMRRFWDWADGQPDLTLLIHQWLSGKLGDHVRSAGAGGQIVVLLRGQLIRRYPNLVIYAWRASGEPRKLIDTPGQDDIRAPVFAGQFDPDVSFAGFALTDADLNQGAGWFFVLQEQPTEPRFGLDETSSKTVAQLSDWSDAAWTHTNIQPGQHLRIAGNPLNGRTVGGVTFGRNAAHLGRILLQKPMRVAIHGKHMLV